MAEITAEALERPRQREALVWGVVGLVAQVAFAAGWLIAETWQGPRYSLLTDTISDMQAAGAPHVWFPIVCFAVGGAGDHPLATGAPACVAAAVDWAPAAAAGGGRGDPRHLWATRAGGGDRRLAGPGREGPGGDLSSVVGRASGDPHPNLGCPRRLISREQLRNAPRMMERRSTDRRSLTPLVVCRGFGDPVQGGLSAGDFVEDLVGGFGPDEGLGVVVPVGDPAVDPVRPPENWSTADVVVASCVAARVGARSRRVTATIPANSLSQPFPDVEGGPYYAACLSRQMVHLNSRGTKQPPNQ